MADISKIQVGGTSYNIKDETARTDISSLQSDVEGLMEDVANRQHFRGYYETTAEVQAIPNPEEGDYAWNAQTGTVWNYTTSWSDSGENIPDQTVPRSNTTPLMDGTASIGSQSAYAAGDHRHPTDTTRASAADLSAEVTARQSADTSLGNRITTLENAGYVTASYEAGTETLVLAE